MKNLNPKSKIQNRALGWLMLVLCPLLLWAENAPGIPGVELFKLTPRSANRAFDAAEPERSDNLTNDQQLVTMIVKDADVASVLQLLATEFKLNMLVTGDVKGTVTFQFTEVPLQTVLDVLTRAASCNYVRDGSVITIKPDKNRITGDMQTKIYNLSYVDANDIKTVLAKVISAGGIVDLFYRRVGDGGTSKRSSVLFVRDLPEYLAQVDKVVQDLDQPCAQVSIEAKFIETTLSGSDLYGIDWNVDAGITAKIPDLNAPKAGANLTIPARINNVLIGTIELGRMAAVLQALESHGNARLLANPRTITLDNQTANMTISTNYPIQEVRVDPGTQAVTTTFKQQAIPITLDVTPHVLPDGTVDMSVNAAVEAVTGFAGPPGNQSPITSRRDAKTQIRVRDGEVGVIGGLMREEATKTVKTIPGLGSIPVIGELFKFNSMTMTKTDLLIFIIPHVISPQ